jgi:uncharacterized protein (DUF1800 family)
MPRFRAPPLLHCTHSFKLGATALLTSALLIAGCGGGAGTSTPANSHPSPSGSHPTSWPKPTPASASRYLAQATYGATPAEIDRVVQLGYEAWLEQQFAKAPLDTHAAYIARKGPPGCNPCDSNFINATMESFWRQAILGEDQLRQRAVFALSQIFVVSAVNSAVDIQADAHAAYLDMLARNSFGNFRTLLEEVSLHPTMGIYLSHMRNQKEDPATGRIPDQNFAREIMQLFSIGLWQLNPDGSRKLDGGKPIPTYTQKEITGMSRVFTGWSWGGPDAREERWHGWVADEGIAGSKFDLLMQPYAAFHSSSAKQIIHGITIPANTHAKQTLRIALDALFNHPNVGPFIGSQLIKRLVTSNPSPEYVARVSKAFDNNGQGVRGDMKAVWRAVLLDPEARGLPGYAQTAKLREPLLRYGQFMRSFQVKSDSTKYQIWNLEDPTSSLGQNPLRSPSVFNWYRPDYSPPGALRRAGILAPEFQITHETTVTGYTNFILYEAERTTTRFKQIFGNGRDYLATDYAAERALAGHPAQLIDHLNLILLGNRMSASLRSNVLAAVQAVPNNSDNDRFQRVSTAVGLIMVSPEYLILK